MKIEKQLLENHQVKIQAEFDPDSFATFKQRSARKLAREHKFPGFRPGKAPYAIVVRQFGEEHIEQAAIELMLDEVYPNILDDAEINPSGPGSLEEIIQVNPPILSFIVPLAPEVELFDYKSIRKEYQIDSLTDEEINTALKNLQQNYASAEPVEREAQSGDLLSIKLIGTDYDGEQDQDPEKYYDTSTQIIVGESEFGPDSWPFVGFSSELIGLKEKEEKEIIHKFPDDHENERVRGKQIRFKVTIDGVKEIKLPDLNDDFAKTLGNFEKMDDLLAELKTNLEKQKVAEHDQEYINEIINEIVEKSSIKYPPNVLKDQVEKVLQSIEEDLAKQNLDLTVYLKTRNLEKDAFIEEEVKPIAVKRLEQSLVLEKIGKEENITVESSELQPVLNQSLEQLQTTPGFEKFSNKKAYTNIANAVAFDVYSRLYSKNVLSRLKDIASGALEKLPETETNNEEGQPATDNTSTESSDNNLEITVPESGPKKKRKNKKPEASEINVSGENLEKLQNE